jgi:hypothetical protein
LTRLNGIFGKRALGGALVALALGTAMPAAAQVTAYFPEPGGPQTPTNIALPIQVHASIGGSCTFAAGGEPNDNYLIPTPLDTSAWSRQVPMTLNCTGPSRLAIVSSNGGLLTGGTPAVGYATLAPYTVNVSIAQPSAGAVTGSCLASALQTGSAAACTLRGTASATVGIPFSPTVGLTTSFILASGVADPVTPNLLVPGTYTDTLVVTVSPAS